MATTRDREKSIRNIEMINKCIEFVKSSLIFDIFLTSHDMGYALLQIDKKVIEGYDDIGEMLNAIIGYLIYKLTVSMKLTY